MDKEAQAALFASMDSDELVTIAYRKSQLFRDGRNILEFVTDLHMRKQIGIHSYMALRERATRLHVRSVCFPTRSIYLPEPEPVVSVLTVVEANTPEPEPVVEQEPVEVEEQPDVVCIDDASSSSVIEERAQQVESVEQAAENALQREDVQRALKTLFKQRYRAKKPNHGTNTKKKIINRGTVYQKMVPAPVKNHEMLYEEAVQRRSAIPPRKPNRVVKAAQPDLQWGPFLY